MKKRILPILLAAMMAATFSACGSTEAAVQDTPASESAEPVSGGWTLSAPAEPVMLNAKTADAFAKAAGDKHLTPVSLVAQQVVAGTNDMLLCYGDDGYHMAILYRDLQGGAEMTSDQRFPLEDYTHKDAEPNTETLAGGWSVPEEQAALPLPEDAKTALDKALSAFTGSNIEPLALLGTQVVAGTNYAMLCRVTPVTPDAAASVQVVTVYADLQGNAEFVSFCAVDPAAFNQ